MLQHLRSIIGKNERTKNNNKNKCSEIGNNEVLNIEGRQDFGPCTVAHSFKNPTEH